MRTVREHSPSLAPSSSVAPRSGPSLQLKNTLRGLDFAAQDQLLTPVQADGRLEGGDVHAAAAAGVAGSGGSLPHLDAIQRSFGGHDVSAVQAHTGGAAKDAASSIGASAYATGDHVAFGESPDLHTAAHEAAHIVQQKGGVSLSGGVGQSGDRYEQHADHVADAVVQGKSAEGLLDQMAGGPSVQMKSGSGRTPVQKQGGATVSWDVVQGVFMRLLKEKAAALGLPEDDPKVMDAAMAATKTQIGPGNYAMWENRGSATVGEITTAQPPQAEEESEEDDEYFSPGAMYERMKARAVEMGAKASAIGKEVVAMEAKCQRLASPEGISGFLYETGMGTMGVAYGTVARGAGLAVDAVNPFTHAQSIGTYATGGESEDTAWSQMGDTFTDIPKSTGTSIDLMTGKLDELYQRTRPAHAAYEAASGRFTEARGRFFSSNDVYLGGADAMKDMAAALTEMSDAANTYSSLCSELGIPANALRLDKLDKAVVDGGGAAVDVSVGFLAGGVFDAKPSGPSVLGKHGNLGQEMAKDVGAKTAQGVMEYAPTGAEKVANTVAGTVGDGTALIK